MPRGRKKRNRNRTSSSSVEIQVTKNEASITATSTVSSVTSPTLSQSNHGPALFLAQPDFLNLLKEVGAKGQPSPHGEIFHLKELANLLTKYIFKKQIFDEDEPTVVYCDKDPLGKVFGVSSFTVQDARTLLLQHCSAVGSLWPPQGPPPSKNPEFTIVQSDLTPPPCLLVEAEQVVTSTVNENEGLSTKDNLLSNNGENMEEKPANDSSGHDTDDGGIRTPANFTVVSGPSSQYPNDSGTGTDMGELSLTRGTEGTPQILITPSGSQDSGAWSGLTFQSSGSMKEDVQLPRNGKGVKRKRHWTDSGLLETRVSSDGESGAYSGGRKRGSSFSLVLDNDVTSIQWELLIPVTPASDGSEILSVQSKETAYARDTTDDPWSSDDEVEAISIEISPHGANIDPPFPVEFGLDSDDEQGQQTGSDDDDDSDSTAVLEEIYVVCPESDMEWWADSESSDSESDISIIFDIPEGDKWKCANCGNLNTPLLRSCDRCMSTRPDWLPVAPARNNRYLHRQSITSSGEEETDTGPPSRPLNTGSTSILTKSNSEPNPNIHSSLTLATASQVKKAVSDPGTLADPSNSPQCMICYAQPKDACIIHGKTGHQVCCYGCAKKLRRRGKPCPVCRRNIQRVVRNFLV